MKFKFEHLSSGGLGWCRGGGGAEEECVAPQLPSFWLALLGILKYKPLFPTLEKLTNKLVVAKYPGPDFLSDAPGPDGFRKAPQNLGVRPRRENV